MRRVERETIQWYLDSCNPEFNGNNLQLLEEQIHSLAAVPDCRVAFGAVPADVEIRNRVSADARS